jgi:hypothetical protein
MGKAKPERGAVPPCIEAIIVLGGPTKAARRIGHGLTPEEVAQWMRDRSVPMGWVRLVSRLSEVPLEQFYRFEEAKAMDPPSRGTIEVLREE